MKTNELVELRKLINDSINKQLPEKDRKLALAISNVVTGMAYDLGRIADAIEHISNKVK